jgi:hypothetical protein
VSTVFAKHIKNPSDIQYRTDVSKSGQDVERITQNQAMLVELRNGPLDGVSITQQVARDAMAKVAAAMEARWHLSTEAGQWSVDTAKKVRAMLRDIASSIAKHKRRPSTQPPPSWLEPFLIAEQDTRGAGEAHNDTGEAASALEKAHIYRFGWDDDQQVEPEPCNIVLYASVF